MSKIYDPEADSRESFLPHFVFKDGVKVKFPDTSETAKASMVILPAFPTEDNPAWAIPPEQKYAPYRRFDVPLSGTRKHHQFAMWIRHYFVYEWVGGKVNIISPRSYADERISGGPNPIGTLYDFIKSDVAHKGHLIGLNPDGKKPKDEARRQELFKSKILSPAARKFVLNSSTISNRGLLEPVSLFSVPDGAVMNKGNREGESSTSWGLFDELNRTARGVDPARLAADPSAGYYWGDITNPAAAITVELSREAPPTGGTVKLYVMKPVDAEARIISGEMLANRIKLDQDGDIFVPYDNVAVIKLLITVLGDKYPDLLIGALSGSYPIKQMLDNYLVRGGDEDDEIPMHHPAPTAPVTRGYAPAPVVPPAPVTKEYWVVDNGQTKSCTHEELASMVLSRGARQVQAMSKEPGASWCLAADLGFFDPPPPPPAPAAPPPPPAPAAPPPPPAPVTPPPPPVAAALLPEAHALAAHPPAGSVPAMSVQQPPPPTTAPSPEVLIAPSAPPPAVAPPPTMAPPAVAPPPVAAPAEADPTLSIHSLRAQLYGDSGAPPAAPPPPPPPAA